MERTALREVHEETGLLVRLLQAVGRIRYTFGLGGVCYDKTVDFYLMQATGGDTADHDVEYDFAQWFSVDEAVRQIAYPNEARIVEKALSRNHCLSVAGPQFDEFRPPAASEPG